MASLRIWMGPERGAVAAPGRAERGRRPRVECRLLTAEPLRAHRAEVEVQRSKQFGVERARGWRTTAGELPLKEPPKSKGGVTVPFPPK